MSMPGGESTRNLNTGLAIYPTLWITDRILPEFVNEVDDGKDVVPLAECIDSRMVDSEHQ